MVTKIINLYTYDELNDKAKEKARNEWIAGNDYSWLQSDMINVLKEKLDERGLKYDVDSIDVRYSLSYCQGDGFMFVGKVMWRDVEITITHGSNHYSHKKTADFGYNWLLTNDELGQFKAVYESICDEMERIGYDGIEYEDSEENFIEACESNEYTFREDGTMENI